MPGKNKVSKKRGQTITHLRQVVIEALGWYGMTALVTAYMLASFQIVVPEGVVFQVLNLTGALALLVYATIKRSVQIAVLNVFWIVIALIALANILLLG